MPKIIPDTESCQGALTLGSATLHEAADQVGALPSAIQSTDPHFRLCGPALPITCAPGDNLWIHRALYEAAPGDILVVATGDLYEAGYWGEIMSHAARARRVAGVVIDGCVRDTDRLADIGVPVFARGSCIRGTRKDTHGAGSIGGSIAIGDAQITRGDVVIGDADGVVVLCRDRFEETLRKAYQRQQREREIIQALQSGKRTLDIYGWE